MPRCRKRKGQSKNNYVHRQHQSHKIWRKKRKVFVKYDHVCIRKQRNACGIVQRSGSDGASYLIQYKNGAWAWYRHNKISKISQLEYNDGPTDFVIDKTLPSPSPTPTSTPIPLYPSPYGRCSVHLQKDDANTRNKPLSKAVVDNDDLNDDGTYKINKRPKHDTSDNITQEMKEDEKSDDDIDDGNEDSKENVNGLLKVNKRPMDDSSDDQDEKDAIVLEMKSKKAKKEQKTKPKQNKKKYEKRRKKYKLLAERERSYHVMVEMHEEIDLNSLHEYIEHFGAKEEPKWQVQKFFDKYKNHKGTISFSQFAKTIDEDGDVMKDYNYFKKFGMTRPEFRKQKN